MSLTPNKSDILAHLTALFPPSFVHKHPDAKIEIAYGMPDIGPSKSQWFSVFEPERAVDFAAARNIEGNNIYVGAALRIGDGTVAPFGRGDDKAFLAAAHGWIDLDGAGECEKADAVIKELQLEPSIVVTTGSTPYRRIHAYFPIKDGVADGEQLRAANTALRSRLGGDPVQAPSHVMRLAGTVNYPSTKKRARGYVAELVTLRVEKTARAHAVEDIINLGASPSSIQGRKTGLGFDLRRSDTEITALLEETRTSGNWHQSMLRAIASMIGRGWEDLAIRHVCGPYCQDGPMDSDLTPMIDGARKKWNKPEPTQGPSSEHSWLDPDWSLLDDRRGELPEFPLGVLPKWVRDWAALASHGAGVTPGHVVVPLLGIASSIIGSARRVQASRSWLEPMTCWTAVVGYSGTGKTPGIDVTKRHLAAIEKIRAPKVAELKRKHETRAEAAKAALKKWKSEVADAVGAGMPAPPRPDDATDVGEFVTPRLYISDSTIERLAILLQASPRGALVIADELAGLFLNMGRYSNGSDREFWLEAWNGKGYVVERMGRPAVHLENLLVGIVGGLQPDKLVKSFEGDHDGMYARVCFSWPEEPAYKPLTNDVAEIEPDLINALCRLIDLDDGDDDEFVSRPVPLSSEATAAFEQFRQFLHDGKAGLDGRGREWWSKGASHVLRLAGTLTFLEWSNVGGDEPVQVPHKFVAAAIELWRNYFWPHSQAALRQIGLTERHANTRQVLRWIRVHGKREIGTRDIRREALGQRLDAEQTSDLVEFLVKAGWLKPLEPVETGGRPARRWLTNEVLHRGAESAESAESPPRRPQTPLSALPALSAPGFGECLETVGATGDSLDDFK